MDRKWRNAKDHPDPVFKYRSKATARGSSANSIATSTCHGRPVDVGPQRPSLCAASRAETSDVSPV